jgi:hypothetical protein
MRTGRGRVWAVVVGSTRALILGGARGRCGPGNLSRRDDEVGILSQGRPLVKRRLANMIGGSRRLQHVHDSGVACSSSREGSRPARAALAAKEELAVCGSRRFGTCAAAPTVLRAKDRLGGSRQDARMPVTIVGATQRSLSPRG